MSGYFERGGWRKYHNDCICNGDRCLIAEHLLFVEVNMPSCIRFISSGVSGPSIDGIGPIRQQKTRKACSCAGFVDLLGLLWTIRW